MKNQNELSIIAEIGLNHEGSIECAKKLLTEAASTGVQYVKFQSYTTEKYAAANDPARITRLKKFSLTRDHFYELASLANSLNVKFISTPLSEDWVELLNPIVSLFKIASGDITFKPVIEAAALTGKPLIISTGAATISEIDQAVEWVKNIVGASLLSERLTLMHCVAAYPTPIDQANLHSIPFLKEKYKLNIGYSNHVMGMNACITAVALGASPIEVHYTDNKHDREFRDHALSFDFADLKSFVTLANVVRSSLGTFEKKVQDCEKEIIPNIRKGIIAKKNLAKGHVLTKEDLAFARPGTNFKSSELDLIIGKKLSEEVQEGFLIPKNSVILS